jgi:hypothetical protein
VTGGSVGIQINDNVGSFFQTKKGLRQGDPLSPILFNLVADMLALLVSWAREDNQLKELCHIWWMEDCQFSNMQMTQFYS